jgi:DNA-binding MarR family transcriptional regulator
MSKAQSSQPGLDSDAGLTQAEADAIGGARATQVRSFRLLLRVALQLRYLTDQLYRADGLTTQQAMLLTIVRTQGQPSLSDVSAAMHTTHQNVRQLVNALVTKGFLQLIADPNDARVRRIATTKKNDRHWAARDPLDFDHVRDWFSVLSVTEARQLHLSLSKLQLGLKEHIALAAGETKKTRARSTRKSRGG